MPEKVDLSVQRKKSPTVKSGNNTISTSGESSYSDDRGSVGSLNSIQFAADKSKKALDNGDVMFKHVSDLKPMRTGKKDKKPRLL